MSSQHDRHNMMLDEALGPEVLTMLANPKTQEIMLNADGTLWVEYQGKAMEQVGWRSATHIERIIRLTASWSAKEVTHASPSLAATLPTGQRFQGYLPPLVEAPTITIRCPSHRTLMKKDFVPSVCSEEIFDALSDAVTEKKNIVVSGELGSGKTALVSTLMSYIGPEERIGTAEDVKELRITGSNFVRFYTNKDRDLYDCTYEALRARIDRFIPSEIRDGKAALATLNAWLAMTPGGLCTVHAKSAMATLTRLEYLCAQTGKGDYRPLIGEVVDIIVHMERVDRQRRISNALRIDTWNGEHYVTKNLLEH